MAEVYIDPDTGSDTTGTGTSGNPYETLQHAITNTSLSDYSNFYVADTADETLTANFDWVTTNDWSADTTCLIQGWDRSGSNGGYGTIDCSTYNMHGAANDPNHLAFYKMRFKNGPTSGDFWDLGEGCSFIDCEFIDCGATSNTLAMNHGCRVCCCYFENCDGNNCSATARGNSVTHCVFKQGTNSWTRAAFIGADSADFSNNIVWMSQSTGDGVLVYLTGHVRNNSFYQSSSGNGDAITFGTNPWDHGRGSCVNNAIEGFSLGIGDNAQYLGIKGYNAFYNNTTDETGSSNSGTDLSSGDVTPGATLYADAANGDFTPISNLQGAGWPTTKPGLSSTAHSVDIGAVQVAAAGGVTPVQVNNIVQFGRGSAISY